MLWYIIIRYFLMNIVHLVYSNESLISMLAYNLKVLLKCYDKSCVYLFFGTYVIFLVVDLKLLSDMPTQTWPAYWISSLYW